MLRSAAIIPAGRAQVRPARRRRTGLATAAIALLLAGLQPLAVRAGVQFENCVHGSDGSISCDTVPTGDTLLDDESARFGLLQNASPGWSEFDPYEGFEDEFGGNQT